MKWWTQQHPNKNLNQWWLSLVTTRKWRSEQIVVIRCRGMTLYCHKVYITVPLASSSLDDGNGNWTLFISIPSSQLGTSSTYRSIYYYPISSYYHNTMATTAQREALQPHQHLRCTRTVGFVWLLRDGKRETEKGKWRAFPYGNSPRVVCCGSRLSEVEKLSFIWRRKFMLITSLSSSTMLICCEWEVALESGTTTATHYTTVTIKREFHHANGKSTIS